jgi:hypothetical protein
MYEKDDLPKETTSGVGVFLIVFTQLFKNDNFKLPTPCRPKGVEFCCFKGPYDCPKAPPNRSPNTSSLLEGVIPEIPITNLNVGIYPQLLHVRCGPFDWGCDYPKTTHVP